MVVSFPADKIWPNAKQALDSERKPKYFWDPVLFAENMAQHKCTKASAKRALRRKAQNASETESQRNEQRSMRQESKDSKCITKGNDHENKDATRQSETTGERD